MKVFTYPLIPFTIFLSLGILTNSYLNFSFEQILVLVGISIGSFFAIWLQTKNSWKSTILFGISTYLAAFSIGVSIQHFHFQPNSTQHYSHSLKNEAVFSGNGIIVANLKSTSKNTKHILSIMVDNEPGVLARIVGLFSGRGYNIESLSVSEVDSDRFLSRVTVVTSGTKNIIDQIKAQVRKLIPVHNLIDITELKSFIGKELILMKLDIKQKTVLEVHKHIKNIGAKILFEDKTTIIIEFSGTPTEISGLIKKMKVYNIVELTRSGLVSMALGKDYIRR